MLQDIFIYSTLIGGGALLIQVAMMFLGLDDFFEGAEGDMDLGLDFDDAGDAGGDAAGFWLLEMLSLRTITAAVAFFGLVGWICLSSQLSPAVSIVVACAAGYAAMYSVYWSLKQLMKLERSGAINSKNAVGLPAKVYIPIPAEQAGAGKVQMKLQERIVEFQAVTDETEQLRTGEQVVVLDTVSSDTLLVERAAESAGA